MGAVNWSSIRPALRDIVAALSGLQTVWADQPQPYVDPAQRAIARLSIKSVVSQGWDENGQDFDPQQPQGFELADLWSGIRKFTLSIRIESFEQSDGKTAQEYCEDVRARLYWRSSVEACHAVNCAVYSDEQTVEVPVQADDRAQSVAVLDLRCRVMIHVIDPDRFSWIENVGLVPNLGLPIAAGDVGDSGASVPISIP